MNLKEFHAATDKFLARAFSPASGNPRPPCAECTSAHCCDEPVYASTAEVDAMLATLAPEQIVALKERVIVWMKKFEPFRELPEPAAIPYRLARNTCPFLVDRRCIAYAERPHGCRVWFALHEAERCHVDRRKEQRFAEFPHGGILSAIFADYMSGLSEIEMDHVGAILVRRLVDPEFYTAASTKWRPNELVR